MADCQRHRAKGYGRESPSASKMPDESIKGMIHTHRQSRFWKDIKDPDQYAYVRWWATVCRREARKRGLL